MTAFNVDATPKVIAGEHLLCDRSMFSGMCKIGVVCCSTCMLIQMLVYVDEILSFWVFQKLMITRVTFVLSHPYVEIDVVRTSMKDHSIRRDWRSSDVTAQWPGPVAWLPGGVVRQDCGLLR